jgi:hypothetical protein
MGLTWEHVVQMYADAPLPLEHVFPAQVSLSAFPDFAVMAWEWFSLVALFITSNLYLE